MPGLPEQSPQARLSAEKQKAMARIELLSGDVEDIDAEIAATSSDDEHDPEGSTLAFERAKTSTLLTQEHDYLKEIERARERLADGTYGTCERCGVPMPKERLAALPVARRCVQCRSISG